MPDRRIAEIFDKTSFLTEDVYDQYSDQFLNDDNRSKIEQQSISNRAEALRLRAEFLCGKDPFSPPINSLTESQRPVNPQKVRNCFAQGYEVYKLISKQDKQSLESARLYKLGLFTETTKEDLKQFDGIWNKLQQINSEESFNQLFDSINNANIKKAFTTEKDAILKTIRDSSSPIAKNNALRPIHKRIRLGIKKLGEFDLFKSDKSHQELKRCGAVYDIGNDAHSWGTNLAWTLAHIRQGNTFIVCSDVLNNKYRAKYSDTPCAFARELCVALKAGYTLHVDSLNNIILRPDKLTEKNLKQLDSTGELGNGVNPSFDEIDSIFSELIDKFRSVPFTYKYSKPPLSSTAVSSSSSAVAMHQQITALEAQTPEAFGEPSSSGLPGSGSTKEIITPPVKKHKVNEEVEDPKAQTGWPNSSDSEPSSSTGNRTSSPKHK